MPATDRSLYPNDTVQLAGVPLQLGVRLTVERVGRLILVRREDVFAGSIEMFEVEREQIESALSGPIACND